MLDRLPGELARLGVAVLPAVDGPNGHRDLACELFLRHAELPAQAPDQVSCLLFHSPSSARLLAGKTIPRPLLPSGDNTHGSGLAVFPAPRDLFSEPVE